MRWHSWARDYQHFILGTSHDAELLIHLGAVLDVVAAGTGQEHEGLLSDDVEPTIRVDRSSRIKEAVVADTKVVALADDQQGFRSKNF